MLTLMLMAAFIPAFAPDDQAPAARARVLFAAEDWYKSQAGKEEAFVGVLKLTDNGGAAGIGRFNPYRLEIGAGDKKDVREVYVGGKPELLRPYIGRKVKIVGKPVEIEVIGRNHREIWPASIEYLAAAPAEGEKPANGPAEQQQVKIVAKGHWPYAQANPDGPRTGQQFVIREPKQLGERLPNKGEDAVEQALKALSTSLKVPGIDFKTHMLVVVTAGSRPTGGYRIDIDKVFVQENQLIVEWTLTPPKGIATQAFTHPALVALVERVGGEPLFVQRGAVGRPKPPGKSD